MSQCVPSWDVEDNNSNTSLKVSLRAPPPSNSMSSSALDVPTLDYEVAELTWKNGQLAMHGLGPPRVVYKPHSTTTAAPTKYTWDKPRAAETLEAIVNQATLQPPAAGKLRTDLYADELVPWLNHNSSTVAAGSLNGPATMTTMDALVPSSSTQPHALLMSDQTNGGRGGCSTRVGSCSGDQSGMVARGGPASAVHEWSSCRDQSVSGSETFGMESSRQLTVETRERELGVKGFTSTSMGSQENTISGKHSAKSTSPDEHDSVCHSRPQKSEVEERKKGRGKSSVSTKRSRAAAIHNQSERRRRDKINQKMKTLQKLVPNANKTDKASMLDEVIEYLKQLQAQIHMMGRMNMSPAMMMPLAMQQQLQMAMMNPMGMGVGMGMGMPAGVMDLNAIGGNRPNIPGMPSVFHPSTFMHPTMASWDMHPSGDRVANHSDPMAAAFLACQPQPMTMEGYGRMAALFQQMQNQTCYSDLKN